MESWAERRGLPAAGLFADADVRGGGGGGCCGTLCALCQQGDIFSVPTDLPPRLLPSRGPATTCIMCLSSSAPSVVQFPHWPPTRLMLPSQVRRNLHIVLSFSPVGDAFRERLRMFPSLVNCTTIDW